MKKFAATMVFLAASVSQAEELWGGAHYGMTTEQVTAATSGLKTISAGDRLGNGAVEKLQKHDVEIAQEKFTAHYFFKGDKLDQVTLAVDKKATYIEASRAATQIKDALTAKYGGPLSCKSHPAGMDGFSCNWAKTGGNVRLYLLAFDEGRPTLNIVYQARLAKDSANL